MSSILSERIAELRRRKSLTQEQLGQLTGVSAQAVSKWENGGAPDVELLPALAHSLGVTIDALFAQDGAPPEDMARALDRWLSAIPGDRRLRALFDLLADAWSCIFHPGSLRIRASGPASCYMPDPTDSGRIHWLRSRIRSGEGLALGVLADNLPLLLLAPEPPEGYAAHLPDAETGRALFSALSKPGSLDILLALHAEENRYRSAPVVARLAGLSPETVEPLLDELCSCGLLTRIELELEDQSHAAYALHDSSAFVPFMLLARWLTCDNSFLFSYHPGGVQPILRKEHA